MAGGGPERTVGGHSPCESAVWRGVSVFQALSLALVLVAGLGALAALRDAATGWLILGVQIGFVVLAVWRIATILISRNAVPAPP